MRPCYSVRSINCPSDRHVSVRGNGEQFDRARLTCKMSTSADTSAVGFPAAVRQRVLVPGATKRPALSPGSVHPQRGRSCAVSS